MRASPKTAQLRPVISSPARSPPEARSSLPPADWWTPQVSTDTYVFFPNFTRASTASPDRRSPSSIRAIKADILAPEHAYKYPSPPSLFCPQNPLPRAPRPPSSKLAVPLPPPARGHDSGVKRTPRTSPCTLSFFPFSCASS